MPSWSSGLLHHGLEKSSREPIIFSLLMYQTPNRCAQIGVKPPGPKAMKIIELNNRYMSGLCRSISRILQVVFDEAKGVLIKDADGNLYIDLTSAVTCCNTGFVYPRVVKAVHEQIAKVQHARAL